MAPANTERDPSQRPGALSRGLHLAALAGLAIGQPLFAVLGGDPAFFVARGSRPADPVLLALGIALGVPALLVGIVALAARVHRRLGEALQLAFVAGLVALVALAPLKRASADGGGGLQLVAALAIGAAGAWVYARARAVRAFLAVLSPSALLFAGAFLARPGMRAVLAGPSAGERPVLAGCDTTLVHLVFDELPLASLLDADGAVDPVLFPNFARVAGQSVWFRAATASHGKTTLVIPTLLSGLVPDDPERVPVTADYPRNLFTLLAGSHRMRVRESATSLCPPDLSGAAALAPAFGERLRALADDVALVYAHVVLPAAMAADLPSVTEVLADFRGAAGAGEGASVDAGDQAVARAARSDRSALLAEFVESIDDSTEPTLYFLHLMLPHVPWVYEPGGARYPDRERIPGLILRGRWSDEVYPTELALQRHLLQVGALDRMLGEVVERLEQCGVWDRALVVVVGDHGASFTPGTHRRAAQPANLHEILHVPLFVKPPFQEHGRTSDRNVESIDVLPTIVGALGLDPPWDFAGSDALDETRPERPRKRIHNARGEPPLEADPHPPDPLPGLARKLALFGRRPGWEDVWRRGPQRAPLGATGERWSGREARGLRAELAHEARLRAVDPDGPYLPCFAFGTLEAEAGGALPERVAVALGGVVVAEGATFERKGPRAEFAMMLPRSAFRAGANAVELLAIEPDGGLARIPTLAFSLGRDGEGREAVVASDGRTFEVVPGALDGVVDAAVLEDDELHLGGWAALADHSAPAELVLVVQGGRVIYHGPTGVERRGLAELDSNLAAAGFRIQLPAGLVEGGTRPSLRVLALAAGTASELRCGPRAAWICTR